MRTANGLRVGLPYLRQYQNVEEVVQTEGQSVAVTSEAQKAAEEPLLSPMATEEPEESLAPVPTQDTTQESLNPQANGETSEEVSISPTQESMQQEEKKEEQQATADIKTITYTIQRGTPSQVSVRNNMGRSAGSMKYVS